MSPRSRRPENRGFPTGWHWRHNALYYWVPKGREADWDGKREFRLGSTVAEAYQTWAQRLASVERGDITSMDGLCDRYLSEHVPALKPKTRESYTLAVRRIRAVFAGVAIADVTQQHARGMYEAMKRERSAATARATCGVLKHMMTKAAEWGAIPTNTLLGMRFAGAEAATRFLTRAELTAILSLVPQTRSDRVGLTYVRLALLTGLRRGDVLSLRVSDCRDDGIVVTPRKTETTSGVTALFPWTDELRSAVDTALSEPPRRIGDAPLITTRQGKSYLSAKGTAYGFDTLSRRFIDRTVELGLVEARWTMKDLRAAVASHLGSTAAAQEQLMHSSPAVTSKHYRRAPKVIQPVSLDQFRAG